MSLKGKVAIVTGGNSGIGKAIALGLAKAGASIVIDYVVHPEATEALEREIAALGDAAIGVEADISRVEEIQALVQAAVANVAEAPPEPTLTVRRQPTDRRQRFPRDRAVVAD